MPPTITTIPNYKKFLIRVQDAQKQKETWTGFITAHADDNLVNTLEDNFGSMLEDYETLSSAKLDYALLEDVTSWYWTSTKVPETVEFSTVDQIVAANFDRTNPLKPLTAKLNFTAPVFAPKIGTAVLPQPDAGKLKLTTQAMIDFLDYWGKRATVKYDGNGLLYAGFTFVPDDSVVISAPDVVNNQ